MWVVQVEHLVPKDSTYQIKCWVSRRNVGQSRNQTRKKRNKSNLGYPQDSTMSGNGIQMTLGKSKETDKITSNNSSSNLADKNAITSACHRCTLSASVLPCPSISSRELGDFILTSQARQDTLQVPNRHVWHQATALKHHGRRLNSSHIKLSEEKAKPPMGSTTGLTFQASDFCDITALVFVTSGSHTPGAFAHATPRIPCIPQVHLHTAPPSCPRSSHLRSLPWLVFLSYTPLKIILFFNVIY